MMSLGIFLGRRISAAPFLLSKWMERAGYPTDYLPTWVNKLCHNYIPSRPRMPHGFLLDSWPYVAGSLRIRGRVCALGKACSVDSHRPCQLLLFCLILMLWQRDICRGEWEDSFPLCAKRLLIRGHWEENSLDWEFILEWIFPQQVSEAEKKRAHIISNNGNKQYKFFKNDLNLF